MKGSRGLDVVEETIVDWFDGFGWISLAAMSFTEAIIQPVPPDLLFLPMLVAAEGDTALILWLWIVVSISSVLGSIIGYWLGKNGDDPYSIGSRLRSISKKSRHLLSDTELLVHSLQHFLQFRTRYLAGLLEWVK